MAIIIHFIYFNLTNKKMKRKFVLTLCFVFVGATYGFSSSNIQEEDFEGCVTASACDITVVVCGDTLDELNDQHSDWEEILGCS